MSKEAIIRRDVTDQNGSNQPFQESGFNQKLEPTTVVADTELETDGADLDGKVIVGIPTYNEEIAIGSVVIQAQKYADEVVVVDDGSSDETVTIAAEAGAAVIRHSENQGKGGAIQTLVHYLEDHNVKALVLLDGDGQHIPPDIPSVAEPVIEGNVDVTIGSRYLNGNSTETPSYRRVGQRILDILTTGHSGESVSDSQSGFRALSSKAISDMDLNTDGMGVESEMIREASKHNLGIEEVEIDVRYEEVDGQTHNPVRHGLEVVAFIVQLIRDRHPLLFFGVPGMLALGSGAALGLQTSWLYQTTGAFHQWRALLSGFSILIGTVALFSGLVLSQVRNMVTDSNE